MKCISVMQPFATLILLGVKRYETRSWMTYYRGRLGIHASRAFAEAARELCYQSPYREALHRAGLNHSADLPRGVLLGSVELLACLHADEVLAELTEAERRLGDFTAGRWAWLLGNPQPLPQPHGLSGRRGLFEISIPGS